MMSAHVTNTNLTETEFYHAELHVWGEDYVESLLERGYTPVLTTSGWRWLQTVGREGELRDNRSNNTLGHSHRFSSELAAA